MLKHLRKMMGDRNPVRLLWHKSWGVAGALVLPVEKKMQIVLVTGTKGKTTTAWSLGQILALSGVKTAVCTTALFRIGDKIWANESKMTTPSRLGLRQFLRKAAAEKCEVAIVEASSQASTQSRLFGLGAVGFVWTNLQEDHLEYHGGWENYRSAKVKIMENVQKGGFAVLNMQDKECGVFAKKGDELGLKVEQVLANKVVADEKGINFKVKKEDFSANFAGEFNAQNLAEAIEAGHFLGLSYDKIKEVLAKVEPVPGRLQKVENKAGLNIYIDFSYTPKALEEAIKALRAKMSGGKLWVLTGATGGGRDVRKFPLMGAVAATADMVVLTDDDLGPEDDSDEILEKVAGGFPKNFTDFVKITPREKAVRYAILEAKKGDTILLAGKGCETVQHYGTRKKNYSEIAEVRKALLKR